MSHFGLCFVPVTSPTLKRRKTNLSTNELAQSIYESKSGIRARTCICRIRTTTRRLDLHTQNVHSGIVYYTLFSFGYMRNTVKWLVCKGGSAVSPLFGRWYVGTWYNDGNHVGFRMRHVGCASRCTWQLRRSLRSAQNCILDYWTRNQKPETTN